MAAELEPIGTEGEDYTLVEKGDRTIVVPIRKEGEPYDSNPQIRALQLVQEGRIGGAGRGQGRKRKPRAAQVVAEEVRKRAGKIVDAIDAGLEADSTKTRLEAAGMALKIERDEALLQIKEDEQDIDNQTREELVATLIEIASDQATVAVLEEVIDIPDEDIEEVEVAENGSVKTDDTGRGTKSQKRTEAGARASGRAASNGAHKRAHRRNGRAAASRDREKDANPFTARANGRPAD